MVFGAGLVLIFLGLALVVPGEIPVGQRRITAKAARWAGGILLLFLPMAIVMHVLWRRNAWEEKTPLVNAQWIAFGLLVIIGGSIVLYSMFAKSAPAPRARIVPVEESGFEVVDNDMPAPVEEPFGDVSEEIVEAPVKPPPVRGKKSSGSTPFDFS